MTHVRPAVLVACLLASACGKPNMPLVPATPLGEVANAWFFAHNRGDGHAAVHFADVNRGTASLSGAQQDSLVLAAVTVSKRVGALTPVAVVQAADSVLVLRCTSATTGAWLVTFRMQPPPATERVHVELATAR